TFVPAMAIESGILEGTGIVARRLRSRRNFRRIALAWRKSSPREEEFGLLAGTLRDIARQIVPRLAA
ncbi:MAG TPA: hydrogen peroxide-inducible genes activator, partial [Sphingomicrobium sp.]|nr:hydrogen peroxide-inducible genes activator [Sphingomicrobium sp.]